MSIEIALSLPSQIGLDGLPTLNTAASGIDGTLFNASPSGFVNDLKAVIISFFNSDNKIYLSLRACVGSREGIPDGELDFDGIVDGSLDGFKLEEVLVTALGLGDILGVGEGW